MRISSSGLSIRSIVGIRLLISAVRSTTPFFVEIAPVADTPIPAYSEAFSRYFSKKLWQLFTTVCKIVVYSRETSSGTYEFFKESVLKNKNYMSSSLSMPATGAIIQSVSQTKGAIGYVGLAYINKEVKPIHVSYDAGKTFTEPSFENAKNKAYPIVRPLFYYYDVKNEGKVKPFIDYILSAEGQATVKQVGYIPVK